MQKMELEYGKNKMSFLEFLFGEAKTINKPIFVKGFSKENQQLTDLEVKYSRNLLRLLWNKKSIL